MSRWTELQETIRHRFGLDDVEGGTETPGEERAAPSSALPVRRCCVPRCPNHTEESCLDSNERTMRDMLCRSHLVMVGAELRESDAVEYVFDWIRWTIEMGWDS
jgi:hypothetical protein